jgi:hypothetical protein
MCGNCYRIWQRENFPPNATCEVCGRDYFRRPCASPSGRTCSRECFAIWKRGRDRHNRATDGALPVLRRCEWCGEGFSVEKRQVDKGFGRFCSVKCSALRRRVDPERSMHPENAWRSRMGFRKVAARLLRAANARCAECGERRTSGNLVVHHPIPPNGDVNLLMAEWNLVVLCRACHMAAHRDELREAAA